MLTEEFKQAIAAEVRYKFQDDLKDYIKNGALVRITGQSAGMRLHMGSDHSIGASTDSDGSDVVFGINLVK